MSALEETILTLSISRMCRQIDAFIIHTYSISLIICWLHATMLWLWLSNSYLRSCFFKKGWPICLQLQHPFGLVVASPLTHDIHWSAQIVLPYWTRSWFSLRTIVILVTKISKHMNQQGTHLSWTSHRLCQICNSRHLSKFNK